MTPEILRAAALLALVSILTAGCGSSESPPNGSGASGGSGGSGAGAGGTSGSGACEPNDGVADPPCGALQCNGKCFPTNGLCKAGCQRVGTTLNANGVLFEGNYAYAHSTIAIERLDLRTYESERFPTDSTSFWKPFVKNSVVYWHYEGRLNRSEIGGAPTVLLTTPSTFYNYGAELDGIIYLLGSEWLSIPTAAPAITALTTPSGDAPNFVGYDDQYLYLTGQLLTETEPSRTFRATNASVLTPEQICDATALVDGRVYGDYLYRWGPEVPTVYRRCPKTGGTFTDFATIATPLPEVVAKGDALYGLDELGNLHRIRSSTDDTVIARIDPAEASTVVTDGTYVYLPTGIGNSGALFRIIE